MKQKGAIQHDKQRTLQGLLAGNADQRAHRLLSVHDGGRVQSASTSYALRDMGRGYRSRDL